MTKDIWLFEFADTFFDLFVDRELRTFGSRVMLEADLYNICYDKAVDLYEDSNTLTPEETAIKEFKRLEEELRKEYNAK